MGLFKKEHKICFLYKGTWGLRGHYCRLKYAKKELEYQLDDFNLDFAYIRVGGAVHIPMMFKDAWLPELRREIIRFEPNARFVFY